MYSFSGIRELGQKILVLISKKKRILKLFTCLSLVGMVYVILAYRGDGLTIGGDNVIPLHPFEYLARLPYSSNPWAGFGSPLPPIFALPPLPDILLFSLFSSLNFDIYVGNKLYVFVLATLSAVSIFYLSTTVFHESRNKILIGIVATIAYLYNPLVYADTYKTMVFIELSLVQTGFILFIAFIIRYFQTMRIRYSIYAGLSSFLMLSFPGISAYRLAFLALFGFLGVTFYYSARCRGTSLRTKVANALKAFVVVAVLGFLLNSYWLIPFLQNAGPYSSFASEFQTSGTFNEFSNMINTLRLLNSWSFHTGVVPYANVYFENSVMIILTFAWPIFAFLPLLSREVTKSHKILALYMATVFTILLAWGSESPFGQLYMTVANVRIGSYYFLKPFYNTAVFTQLTLTVEYTLLIGYFSTLLFSRFSEKGGKIFSSRGIAFATTAILMTAIITSSSWPMLTGDVMRNWYDPKQYGVKVPVAYWDANRQLEAIGDLSHKTLLLPRPDVYVGTSWGYQGTSHFYNLMFNTPLVTGNEVPYGISLNRTTLNNIYSVPYKVPEVNDTVDIRNHTKRIIPWQSDTVTLGDETVTIDFNDTFELDKWHQVEFRLLSSEDWSNLTHLAVRLSANMDFERFHMGLGDTNGNVGWWNTIDHTYQKEGGTYFPVETEITITTEDDSVDILLNLKKPQRSTYSMSNVTSVWIQYLVTPGIEANMRIEKLEAIKATVDSLSYARFLAENEVKFLLVDFSIVEGATSDPALWLQMLSNSNQFSLIWQQDQLYIFENLVI
jgi:hypothetical protein